MPNIWARLSAGAEWWNIEKSAMSILWCQVRSPNYGGVCFFDYKCTILSKLPLISQTDEARVLFHDFLISFYMGDIFIGNILLNKL